MSYFASYGKKWVCQTLKIWVYHLVYLTKITPKLNVMGQLSWPDSSLMWWANYRDRPMGKTVHPNIRPMIYINNNMSYYGAYAWTNHAVNTAHMTLNYTCFIPVYILNAREAYTKCSYICITNTSCHVESTTLSLNKWINHRLRDISGGNRTSDIVIVNIASSSLCHHRWILLPRPDNSYTIETKV